MGAEEKQTMSPLRARRRGLAYPSDPLPARSSG
jgi:hypothetical protein